MSLLTHLLSKQIIMPMDRPQYYSTDPTMPAYRAAGTESSLYLVICLHQPQEPMGDFTFWLSLWLSLLAETKH